MTLQKICNILVLCLILLDIQGVRDKSGLLLEHHNCIKMLSLRFSSEEHRKDNRVSKHKKCTVFRNNENHPMLPEVSLMIMR